MSRKGKDSHRSAEAKQDAVEAMNELNGTAKEMIDNVINKE